MIQVCAIIQGRIGHEDSLHIAISVGQNPKSAFEVEPQRLEGKVDFSKRLLVGPMFARINNKSLHDEPGYREHKKAYITQKGNMIVRVHVHSALNTNAEM
jgi:hypothetical protein